MQQQTGLDFYAQHAYMFKTMDNKDIAKELGVVESVISKWRHRLGIEHPRKARARKARELFGKIPDRYISKLTGQHKACVQTMRLRCSIDNSRFEGGHKRWIDSLLGLDSDEKLADICEVSVEFIQKRREALGIEPPRRRFLISTRESAKHKYQPPREYELINITRNGVYVFKILDTGTIETFTRQQLGDAIIIKETTRRLLT